MYYDNSYTRGSAADAALRLLLLFFASCCCYSALIAALQLLLLLVFLLWLHLFPPLLFCLSWIRPSCHSALPALPAASDVRCYALSLQATSTCAFPLQANCRPGSVPAAAAEVAAMTSGDVCVHQTSKEAPRMH